MNPKAMHRGVGRTGSGKNSVFRSHSFVSILVPSLRENCGDTRLYPLSLHLFFVSVKPLHLIHFCVLGARYINRQSVLNTECMSYLFSRVIATVTT